MEIVDDVLVEVGHHGEDEEGWIISEAMPSAWNSYDEGYYPLEYLQDGCDDQCSDGKAIVGDSF